MKSTLYRRHAGETLFLVFVEVKLFQFPEFSAEILPVVRMPEIVTKRVAEPWFGMMGWIFGLHRFFLNVLQKDTALFAKS